MAENNAPAAPAAPPAAQVVVDREQLKIPHFYADKDHDTVKVEYWVDRIDRLKSTHGWSSLQTANNAINSLRGEALHLIVHLQEVNPTTLDEWHLFRKELLESYGSSARDTSCITNLSLTQKKGEPVVKFTHRVTIALREFYQSVFGTDIHSVVSMTRIYTEQVQQQNPRCLPYLRTPDHLEQLQLAANLAAADANARTKDGMGMTIFINGLLPDIQITVKNAKPTSYLQAIREARDVERNLAGPSKHTIALETPAPSKTAVNNIRRGGFRGRSSQRGGRSSASSYSTRSTGNATASRNSNMNPSTDCWYCHNKGHLQINCRKRISRGAALVKRPRSVQEIEMDTYAFQEDYDDEDTDGYLDQSLAAVDDEPIIHEEDDYEDYIASISFDDSFTRHLN